MDYVLLGNGIAALTALESIKKNDKDAHITMISNEQYPTYFRIKLSHALGQDYNLDNLFVKRPDFYKESNINLMLQKNAEMINTKDKFVALDNGDHVKYDKLIIATGSHSFIPSIKGTDKKGVFAVRNLKDVENINEYIRNKKSGIVVGGGLLGLETAWSLSQAGYDINVVEFFPRLLPRQSDEEGSEILKEKVEEKGIKLTLGAQVDEITGDTADGVLLKDGRRLNADFVIFSAGVRPNINVINKTDINANKGIVVDEYMRTNVDDIYAAGDVAEYNGKIFGLWTIAMAQGRIAGVNASGAKKPYKEIIPSSTLKVTGIDVFSSGDISSENSTIYSFRDKNIYYKLFLRQNTMIGAILIGDIAKSTKVKMYIDNKMDMSKIIENSVNAKDIIDKI